jgi:uncharacterized protein (DUF885 family)
MMRWSSMRRHDVEVEIDRYIAWPGQALAYMVGEQEIFAARAEAEKRLGKRFVLKEFHDQLLGSGSVPMESMRRGIAEWAAGKR